MNDHFHLDLDSYKDEVIWYGRFAYGMLKSSVSAFESGDEKIASDIIRQKEYVSDQYELLNSRGILLIALNQPMATDLRAISCSMDVVTSSERIGRYGKDIAELVTDSPTELAKFIPQEELLRIGELTLVILETVYNYFESDDDSILKKCAKIEDEIDTLYDTVYNNTVKLIESGDISALYGSACLMVNRYLERCADHACRMGEKIYYMKTGKRIALYNIGE